MRVNGVPNWARDDHSSNVSYISLTTMSILDSSPAPPYDDHPRNTQQGMSLAYDTARLDALSAELGLLSGPFDSWKRLPFESMDGVGERDVEMADEDEGEGADDEYMEEDYDGPERYRGIDKYDLQEKIIQRLLRDLCAFVRQSEGCSNFDTLVAKAAAFIDQAKDVEYGDDIAMSKSFAHSADCPLLEDLPFETGMGNLWQQIGTMLHSQLTQEFGPDFIRPLASSQLMKAPPPWAQSFRPHLLTTKLSRFKEDVDISPTHEQVIASAVYTARCEIIEEPIDNSDSSLMLLSPNAEVLVRTFQGSDTRTWFYDCYNLADEALEFSDFPEATSLVSLDPRGNFYRPITGLDVDESRKLMFLADDHEIAAFRWGHDDYSILGLPVESFPSKAWHGPIATITGVAGRLIRAGKGTAGVWDIESEIVDGENVIHEALETWPGKVAATTTFEDPQFTPAIWRSHPVRSGVMLSGNDYETTKSYSFVSLDLETGKFSSRYIGHGGAVQQISTVAGQPQTFTTACLDGFVRLWDTRKPLPILTIQVGHEGCTAAAYANPDGIPTIFTGAGQQERIRLWDVRARGPVYELATGNNAVQSLTWDSKRNHLWAVTMAESREHGYRPAVVPFGQETPWDNERLWPTRAFHFEDYFGVMHDAGDHTLIRYAFREDPDALLYPGDG